MNGWSWGILLLAKQVLQLNNDEIGINSQKIEMSNICLNNETFKCTQ